MLPLRPFNREQGWLLPPTLDELIAVDHPARFVASFVDGLDRETWEEMGIDLDGDPMGAGAYHPRALLGIWVYGFVSGVRSSRKLETACREQIPYMWLAAMQQPDHNTLWRFYKAHRDRMRSLMRRTVGKAVEAGLVELAVQAVDGTKIAGNASTSRTYNAKGLRRLLGHTEAAIKDLEEQNSDGGLSEELAGAQEMRQRVSDALGRVEQEGGANYENLTDPDAGLLHTRGGGYIAGYNAQAMVTPLKRSPYDADDGSGMIITAMGVTASPDDHPQLIPMIEASAHNTGDSQGAVTLADAGYHSGANVADCDSLGYQVLMPDTHGLKRLSPYHKEHFDYRPETDTYLCPQGKVLSYYDSFKHRHGYFLRRYRAEGQQCRACPAFGECTSSQNGRTISASEYEPLLRRHRELMATEWANNLYRLRRELPEPAFGLLKECHGARRLLLRGDQNVLSELHLLGTAFNLKSLHRVWDFSQQSTPPHTTTRRCRRLQLSQQDVTTSHRPKRCLASMSRTLGRQPFHFFATTRLQPTHPPNRLPSLN